MPNPFLYIYTILFQAIKFSIVHFFSIEPIDRTLSGATIQEKMDLGVMSMKGNSAFPKAPALDCSVSYPGHSLRDSYPSAEMQSVYFAATASGAIWNIWYGIYGILHNSLDSVTEMTDWREKSLPKIRSTVL